MAATGTLSTTTAAVRPRSLWILDPWRDFVLIVGAPFIILPALWLAQTRFRPEQIYLFVASFGAVGHHLPGMMRAYGDRQLFVRFKWRFVLTPILLAVTCLLFALKQLNAMVLVAYVWGVWHGLMQTYGFLRIYDSKVGSVSRVTTRLDSAMCLTWFGAAVLLSPTRMAKLLTDYYRSGGTMLSPPLVAGLTNVWLAATALITAAFVVNLVSASRRGDRPSPAKLIRSRAASKLRIAAIAVASASAYFPWASRFMAKLLEEMAAYW